MTSRILITGASGFVGRELVAHLASQYGVRLRLALRGHATLIKLNTPYETVTTGDIDGRTQWDLALDGVDVVVHLAARVHVLREHSPNPAQAFRDTNLHGTVQLARAASQRGVKRFVFISSVGVNGFKTEAHKPFTEWHKPQPHNPYAQSKWEAEQALRKVALESGMEFVIIRPPLVYGPNAPGNFSHLVRGVLARIPLPLAAVRNLRSMVGLDNLVNFIGVCCMHPHAANQTFLVSDGQDLSTVDLVNGIAKGLHSKVWFVPIPLWILAVGAALFGQGATLQRLTGNLQVDISKARDMLGWTPPISVDEGLRRATLSWKKSETLL
ncbi:nucleoside-diphosphate sugar epimerase [Rhodoferax lacus]|uniref:Nucleoside-diphosphate sugar epimerase n=1 Tax=Rhodoferax lacus TaxID=2184758 RepID=A0A3E1R994_9BURK|nr:NAD-dependent epimerase/dehydratase family protein [Rhodoferax lacus]RFO95936.1 nucleoside-diphosphate sugar epimerase [Rhodoferax lacus]